MLGFAMMSGVALSVRAEHPESSLPPAAQLEATQPDQNNEATSGEREEGDAVDQSTEKATAEPAASPPQEAKPQEAASDPPDLSKAEIASQLKLLQKQVAALSEKKNDKWPTARFSAELQTDLVASWQDAVNEEQFGEIPDGTDFRRARVGWIGDWKNTGYRIEFDFAQPGHPSFVDVWGEIRELPYAGTVRIGHIFEPFSLDRLTSNRFLTFMERSLVDQAFVPPRSLGIMAYNNNDAETITWAYGIFRPNSDFYGDQVGTLESQAFTGRVTYLPYYDKTSDGRGYLSVGTGYSYRLPNNKTARFRAQPEIRLGSATPNIPFFINTGFLDSDSYQLFNLESVLTLGPFSAQGELHYVALTQVDGPSVGLWGGYAQASYFLTGEYRPWNRRRAVFERVTPLEDFFVLKRGRHLISGTGAWELGARASYANLDDENVQGGRLLNLTAGLNWHLNLYTRVSCEYIRSFLNSPGYGPNGADFFGARFQFEF